jgi:hypothetical protein
VQSVEGGFQKFNLLNPSIALVCDNIKITVTAQMSVVRQFGKERFRDAGRLAMRSRPNR